MRYFYFLISFLIPFAAYGLTDDEILAEFHIINEKLDAQSTAIGNLNDRVLVLEGEEPTTPPVEPPEPPVDPDPPVYGEAPFVYLLGGQDRNGSNGWESIYWVPTHGVLTQFGFSHIPTNDNSIRFYDPFTEMLSYQTLDTGDLWLNADDLKVWSDTDEYTTRCTQRDNPLHWVFPSGEIWTMIGTGGGLEYCTYDLTKTGDAGWTTVVKDKEYGGGDQPEYFDKMGIKSLTGDIAFGINGAAVSNCDGKYFIVGGGNAASDVFIIMEEAVDDANFDWVIREDRLPFGKRTRARDSAVCADGNIYYQGGWDGVSYHNDLWKYDVAAEEWTELTSGATASHYPNVTYDPTINALMHYGGKINGEIVNDLWLYFIDQDRWVDLSEWSDAIGVSRMSNGRAVYVPQHGNITVGGYRVDPDSGRHISIQDDMQFKTIVFDPDISAPGWEPGTPPPDYVGPPVDPTDPDAPPEEQLADIQQMINDADPGSVVDIPPGDYPEGVYIYKSLTVNFPKDATLGKVIHQKAFVEIDCDGCTVNVTGLTMDARETNCIYDNFAFVKATGVDWKVSLSGFDTIGCNVAVLTDNRGGHMTITDSVFDQVGKAWGMTHGIYAGKNDYLKLKNVELRSFRGGGHIVKSRAKTTIIEESILDGSVKDPGDPRSGSHARLIDFPCGGDLTVINTRINGSDRAQNADWISVGTEPVSCGGVIYPSSVTMSGTEIYSDRDRSADEVSAGAGRSVLFNWKPESEVVSENVSGNVFVVNEVYTDTGEPALDHFKWSVQGDPPIPDQSDDNLICRTREVCDLIRSGAFLGGAFL